MLEKLLEVWTAIATSLAAIATNTASIARSLEGARVAPDPLSKTATLAPPTPPAPAPAAEDDLGLGISKTATLAPPTPPAPAPAAEDDLGLGIDPPPPAEEVFTKESILALAQTVATKKGRPVIATILKQMGVKTVTEIGPESWKKFAELLRKAMA